VAGNPVDYNGLAPALLCVLSSYANQVEYLVQLHDPVILSVYVISALCEKPEIATTFYRWMGVVAARRNTDVHVSDRNSHTH